MESNVEQPVVLDAMDVEVHVLAMLQKLTLAVVAAGKVVPKPVLELVKVDVMDVQAPVKAVLAVVLAVLPVALDVAQVVLPVVRDVVLAALLDVLVVTVVVVICVIKDALMRHKQQLIMQF